MENKIFKMIFYWRGAKDNESVETEITEKEMKRFLTNSSPNPWIETLGFSKKPVYLNTAEMISIFFKGIYEK